MKIQFLTSKNSWLNLNKKEQVKRYLKKCSKKITIINNFKDIKKNNDILIILSYFKIIPENFLKRSKYNLVVHESDLPKGKGHSPLFWQILKGKNKVTFTLFEASKSVDSGKYYLKKDFFFKKNYLYDEIKNCQFEFSLSLILKFLKNFKSSKKIKSYIQKGKSTFYKKRVKESSELNIRKSLIKQFNLLRIVNNEGHPAFFNFKGNKYIIKIFKEKK